MMRMMWGNDGDMVVMMMIGDLVVMMMIGDLVVMMMLL